MNSGNGFPHDVVSKCYIRPMITSSRYSEFVLRYCLIIVLLSYFEVSSFVFPLPLTHLRSLTPNTVDRLSRDNVSSFSCLWLASNKEDRYVVVDDPTSINIRDWQNGDGIFIYKIWKSFLSSNSALYFDPEGKIEIDLGGDNQINESYYSCGNDNGCFLVATDMRRKTADTSLLSSSGINNIIGTAGLLVGTPITYYKSGSSLSAYPMVIGAVRRVCLLYQQPSNHDQNDDNAKNHIFKRIMTELEARASMLGATQLIGLAYNDVDGAMDSIIKNTSFYFSQPNSDMYESIGFQKMPSNQQIPGLEKYATQYFKIIKTSTNIN